MAYAGIEIKNLDALVAKASVEPLVGAAMRNLFEDIGENTKERAIDRAPVGIGPGSHGSIMTAISMVMDPQPVPLQVAIDVAPLTNNGFRYAWALDAAKSWVHRARTGARSRQRGRFMTTAISVSLQGAYHYRAPEGKGKTTRRWFSGALDRNRVAAAMEKAVRTIEQRWAA